MIALPFSKATGLFAALVQLSRNGSLALVGCTTAMPTPGWHHCELHAVIRTTGSVMPFQACGTESEPSHEP